MQVIIYTIGKNNATSQKLHNLGVQNFFGVRLGVHELSRSKHFLGKSSFN